jgi:DNA (cytosine-5)-methyltransferase 1
MTELTHVSLFSGIAMIDLAAMWAGFTTIGQVEISDYSFRGARKELSWSSPLEGCP